MNKACECGGDCEPREFNDSPFTQMLLPLTVTLSADEVSNSNGFDIQPGQVFIAHRLRVADIDGVTQVSFRLLNFPQFKQNVPLNVTNNILPFTIPFRPLQTIRQSSRIELTPPSSGLGGDASVVFVLEGILCRNQDEAKAKDFLYKTLTS